MIGRPWKYAWRSVNWHKTDAFIAFAFGCSIQTVNYHRAKVGIKSDNPRYRLKKWRRHHWQKLVKWVAAPWRLPDKAVAAMMGCSRQNVSAWRKKLHRPRTPRQLLRNDLGQFTGKVG